MSISVWQWQWQSIYLIYVTLHCARHALPVQSSSNHDSIHKTIHHKKYHLHYNMYIRLTPDREGLTLRTLSRGSFVLTR